MLVFNLVGFAARIAEVKEKESRKGGADANQLFDPPLLCHFPVRQQGLEPRSAERGRELPHPAHISYPHFVRLDGRVREVREDRHVYSHGDVGSGLTINMPVLKGPKGL